jgi:hypothetical protein
MKTAIKIILTTIILTTTMARAYSIQDIISKKYKTLDWSEPWIKAFSKPETTGVWFIWGNSGNGKSSFVMQLTKELAKIGPVLYDSLEEGSRMTMRDNLLRAGIMEVKKRVLIASEGIEELDARLKKRKSPKFVIIDSIQYSGISFPVYRKFKESHPDKLIIFISHANGTKPASRPAESVKYDADLKIWVEGFKAISNGRYNPGGEFTIWEQGANKYWGIQQPEAPSSDDGVGEPTHNDKPLAFKKPFTIKKS